MAAEARDRPDEVLERPSPARMYDFFLGGENNFEVDRQAAARIQATVPNTAQIAWENRWFLRRAVRYLATEAGISQFLDVGAGLPTVGSVHETAAASDPDSDPHVVYVDNDPLVLSYSRGLLADTDSVGVITADLRRPNEIVDHPDARRVLDFDQPIGLLLVAVLHFVLDAEDPAGLLATYRDALPPGSYLVLSHATHEVADPAELALGIETYKAATAPFAPRSAAGIRALFEGWDLVEPGLVRPYRWRPDPLHDARTEWCYAGVARKSA